MTKLIIVESPTKSKTIKKFLGKDYKVVSSLGHIRDLPAKELGVSIEENFKPKYVIPPKAKKIVKVLKEEAKKAKTIILASDEDREGEAIAWHIAEVLKKNLANKEKSLTPFQRIVFHEITKSAIEEALKNPREIDLNLVNAQQARRILDRIVGYKLSPFLWKKVFRGLSAGRVQSVALRLIVEREREIEKFVPEEYWTIETILEGKEGKKIKALLIKKNGNLIKKLDIKNKKEVEEIIKDLELAEFQVKSFEKKEIKRKPLPPFMTSTLQQTAFQKFRWPAKLTMKIAQDLYENGLCTYHRTDSLNLSKESLEKAAQFIEKNYGKNYLKQRNYKNKSKVAQEAHEAIRPTYPEKTPESLKELSERHFKLYDLIWRRFIASQMSEAIFDNALLLIEARKTKDLFYELKATGQILKFDGFLKVYPMKFEETEIPQLQEGEKLKLIEILPKQNFTQPPPRYNDATLIKALEEKNIGRPSTYAVIVTTIQERNYVVKEKGKFKPTQIGFLVNDILTEHFPSIVDLNFTAKLEAELDEIAQGKRNWVETLKEFYEPFEKNLQQKYEEVKKQGIINEKTDEKCPQCGANLIIRLGKFGEFYACSAFPKCNFTKPLKEEEEIPCPQCQEGKILIKKTKKGKIFYGCSRYPDCNFALWSKPIMATCSQCGSIFIEEKGEKKCSNPNCPEKIQKIK
jgi:DNA topoisomerase I